MSDRTRKFTSAGPRKLPSKAGLPPKLAQAARSAKAGTFGSHVIAVKRRQPCAECAIEITPRERAVHYRDDGTLTTCTA